MESRCIWMNTGWNNLFAHSRPDIHRASEAFASLFSYFFYSTIGKIIRSNDYSIPPIGNEIQKFLINATFNVKSGAPDVFGSSVRESSKLELPE